MPYLSCEKMDSLDFRRVSWHLIIYFILLHLMGLVAAQKCQLLSGSTEITFDGVESAQNVSVVRRHTDALTPLYNMQKLFLNAVQPNPFPKELLRALFTNASFLETTEVVKYEAGYVTCAIIAILFIIFALIFGIIFCTFRYRGRNILPCEGALCAPAPIFLSLLFTLCCLLTGVICTFYMNQKAHDEMGYGVQDLSRTLLDFRLSVSGIPQAITKVVTEFKVPKTRVYDDLESFKPAVNRTVNDKINNEIRPLLEQALKTAEGLQGAGQLLLNADMTLKDMQTRQNNTLNPKLIRLQEDLLSVLTDRNCENCAEASNIVQSFQLGQTKIPSLNASLSNKLSNVRKINLPGIFQKALQAIATMSNYVNTQTSQSFSDVVVALDDTEAEIRSLASSFPINQYIGPINKALLTFEEKTSVYGEEVERYEYYRWIIGVVLSCVLLLIVACTAFGLIFGVWGLYMTNPERSRRRRRDGAGFLILEVYLSFLFSWLLILFVFITFMIGGNLQTLVCKHWVNGDIYKFLDDPKNLPDNVNLQKLIGLRDDSSFTDLYNQCKKGSPIWDVLQFSKPNLDSAFNISQYTSGLTEKIDNFTVNVPALDMMSTIAVRVLQDYNNSGVDQVPFSSIAEKILSSLGTIRTAEVFVPMLSALSLFQSNETIRGQLGKETETLQNILNSDVREQEAAVLKLNESLFIVASQIPTLKAGIQRTVEDITYMKGPLLDGFIEMLRNESKCLLNRAVGYFLQYIDWVKTTITQDVASCRSVPTTLDNARVIVCDNVTDPWNGFWFCLGWCTIALIPSIFLSIKAAQHIAPKSRASLTL